MYTFLTMAVLVICGTLLAALGKDVAAATLFGLAGGMVMPAAGRALKDASKGVQTLGVLLIVVSLLGLTGCGPSARQVGLRSTLAGLQVAQAQWLEWDRVHQQAIVSPVRLECGCDEHNPPVCTQAGTRACIDAARYASVDLFAYQGQAATVDAAVGAAYALIALALADESVQVARATSALAKVVQAVYVVTGSKP